MLKLSHAPVTPRSPHDTAYALLARMYLDQTGEAMPDIARAPQGKPYFVTGPYHFSITHTRRHAFAALSDRPIGIDAEELDRRVNPRLAEKILSPGELARYEAAADKREALLRLWVLKEAQVKFTGQGLRGYPNHTDFSPDDSRIQVLEGCLVAIIGDEDHAL